ncbi:prevent-host-death family protein [Thermincola ferriacetica]|uniref:Antitoxin n=2 Tax=Thermincola TaxID=278993 RepID=D5X957_THEPJ|nr:MULTISPECIES: type II toxin-antitoxin system Phd/YefM family antitoxin [Thermincola]ADG81057.1 prevent-host-death family protein [Thermincola potens JR]KNZ69249.1 prevent-host-death family protein [Thermincola ferriacetica]
MPQIRPVSDLRNNFAEISRVVHETSEPVFLTKNGYGDMVVMSFEAYEKLQFESEVYFKLKEAELQAKQTNQRFSHKEVFDSLRQTLQEKADDGNV